MKIKSHTGEMVDLREKMICGLDKSLIPLTVERITEDGNIWCSFIVTGTKREIVYTPSHLRLLHCPFQVGDDYEFLCNGMWTQGQWTNEDEFNDVPNPNNIRTVTESVWCDMKKNPHKYRHTDKNLRDAPEYKP